MVKLLKALWAAWKKEDIAAYPSVPPRVRPIVVTRWVRTHPEVCGWSDWTLAGVVEKGQVEWCCPEEKTPSSHCNKTVLDAVTAQQDILGAVRHGRVCGTIEYPDGWFHLQWRLM